MLRPEGWSDERIEQLKLLYALPDLSTTEIAARLGGGLSRNAVIGKVHRLGLPLRGKPLPKKRSMPPGSFAFKVVRSIRAKRDGTDAPDVPLPEIPQVQMEARHVGLLELQPAECRWPYGQGPFTFCGCAAIAENRPYCWAHTRQAKKAIAA